MQSPTVSLETVKTLVALHGQTQASKITGLNLNTIKSWSKRYHWRNPSPSLIKPTDVAKTLAKSPQLNATSPSNVVLTELEENKASSKLNLSRYVRDASSLVATHKHKLAITRKAKDVTDIHTSLFPEQDKTSPILNLAIVTGQYQPRDSRTETEIKRLPNE